MAKKSKARKPRAKGIAVIYGNRTARGEKMLKGPWRLVSPHSWSFLPPWLIRSTSENKVSNL